METNLDFTPNEWSKKIKKEHRPPEDTDEFKLELEVIKPDNTKVKLDMVSCPSNDPLSIEFDMSILRRCRTMLRAEVKDLEEFEKKHGKDFPDKTLLTSSRRLRADINKRLKALREEAAE